MVFVVVFFNLKNKSLYCLANKTVTFPFIGTGFHWKLCATLPASHVCSLPQHSHRRGCQHRQADAALSRAHLQSAQVHALRADGILESHFRGGHGSGYGHLHRRKLHSRFVSHAVF